MLSDARAPIASHAVQTPKNCKKPDLVISIDFVCFSNFVHHVERQNRALYFFTESLVEHVELAERPFRTLETC